MDYFDDVKLVKSRDGKLVSDGISSGSFDIVEAKKTEYPSETYADKRDENLPGAIRKLREFMRSDERSRMSKTKAFFEEAKMMEDYEDDFEGKGRIFKSFRVVYEDLDNDALRSYFSFRSAVRRGEYIRPEEENYIYILIDELLMQIGVENAEDGLKKLYDISVNYQYNSWVYGYELNRWMQDYVVYYGLQNKYVRFVFKKEIKADWAIYVLEHTEKFTDEDIFKAAAMLSDYGIEDTPFARKYPEDALHGTATVLKELDKVSRKNFMKSFAALVGFSKRLENYQMFRDAVFFFNDRPESGTFKVDTARIFRKNKRTWKCESYGLDIGIFMWTDNLNAVLRETDRLLRKNFKYKKALKKRTAFMDLEEEITLAIQKYLRDKEEAAKPVIKVDLSMLSNIRSDAEYTRESLLEGVEEEFDFEESDQEETEVPEADDTHEETEELPAGLTEEETGLINCLLSGESASGFARDRHLILSVLVDSINEKLYDIFADTVIDMSADSPEIIEDYLEELEEILRG